MKLHNRFYWLALAFFVILFPSTFAQSVTAPTPTAVLNASDPIGIYVNGQLYSADNSITTVQVPIVNGNVGITGGNVLNITFLANVTGPTPITYKYQIGSNSPVSAVSPTATLTHSLQLPLNVGQEITLTIETPSDDPTVLIIPSNIVAYIPITLVNNQPVPLTANEPVAIGVPNSGSVTALSTIGFNAVNYQQWELPELNNTEFFLTNGMLLNSWLEGNLIEEDTANSIATSVTSQNALSMSQNVLFWVNWAWPSYFLTSNTGASPTNIIYMGFAGNVINSANILLSNTVDGEAPQLTCSNTYNTVTGCGINGGASQYGYYDDGFTVFNTLYENWNGISYSTSLFLKGASTTVTASNGLFFSSTAGTQYLQYAGKQFTNGIMLGGLSNCTTAGSTTSCVAIGTAKAAAPTTNELTTGINGAYRFYAFDWGTSNNIVAAKAVVPYQFQTIINASTVYHSVNGIIIETNTVTYPTWVPQNALVVQIGSSAQSYNQWFRISPAPPNGVFPATIFGSVTTPITQVAISNPTNAIVDVGQYQSVTATVTGGVQPLLYAFNAVNSVTPGTVVNSIVDSGVNSQTQLWTWYIDSATESANSPLEANVYVQDTNGQVFNSIYSSTYVVNPALSDIGFTVASNPIDYGQTEVLTSTVSRGSPGYTYNFLVYNSVGLCTSFLTVNTYAQNAISFTQPVACGTGTFTANAFVIDSATTNVIVTNTLTYIVDANPMPTLSASNSVLDSGQYETFTGTAGGGVQPYTYNYFNITGNKGLKIYSGVLLTSNTYTFQVSSPTSNNAFKYNVTVTDTFSAVANSIPLTITVNPALVAGTPTASNAAIDNGQYSTITSNPSGGTPSYTAYQWYTGASCTSPISGATSSTYLAQPTATTTYYYSVKDSASTPVTQCSAGMTVYVSPALAWGTWTESPNPAYTGSSTTLAATITGGTSGYTYNYLVYNSVGLCTSYVPYNNFASNSYTFTQPSSCGTGTFTANIIVTDYASTPEAITNTLTYTVQAALTLTQFTCNFIESNQIIMAGTLYQNNVLQANTLVLYATTNGIFTAWQNYSQIFYFPALSTGYVGSGSNTMATLYIPPGNYFEASYSGMLYFTEQCITISGGTPGNPFDYVPLTLLVLAIGFLLTLGMVERIFIEERDWDLTIYVRTFGVLIVILFCLIAAGTLIGLIP